MSYQAEGFRGDGELVRQERRKEENIEGGGWAPDIQIMVQGAELGYLKR